MRVTIGLNSAAVRDHVKGKTDALPCLIHIFMFVVHLRVIKPSCPQNVRTTAETEVLAKAAKKRNGLRLSSAVPKIQWDSNPHCPYGY